MQIQELDAEDPVGSHWGMRPVALVLGIVGAFFAVLAMSVLFAHPAGASTLAGSSGVSGVVSSTAQSAIALGSDVADAAAAAPTSPATTSSNPAGRPVAALSHVPAAPLRSLAPVVEPFAKTVTPVTTPLSQVVTTLASTPTTLTDALSPVIQLVQPTALFGLEPGAAATTTSPFDAAAERPAGSPFVFGVQPRSQPRSPGPLPAPAWPLQSFPLVTNGSPTGDSSSSSGGSGLAAAPVPGPLLPDPLVSGVITAQGGIPRLLLDLRSSPPG